MTPRAPLERVEELREYLRHRIELKKEQDQEWEIFADLLTILSDYAAMRAELSHAKEVAEGAGYRLANVEAQLEKIVVAWKARTEKAEAQLAKQAPLIEAVMGGTFMVIDPTGRRVITVDDESHRAILRAALALREERGK